MSPVGQGAATGRRVQPGKNPARQTYTLRYHPGFRDDIEALKKAGGERPGTREYRLMFKTVQALEELRDGGRSTHPLEYLSDYPDLSDCETNYVGGDIDAKPSHRIVWREIPPPYPGAPAVREILGLGERANGAAYYLVGGRLGRPVGRTLGELALLAEPGAPLIDPSSTAKAAQRTASTTAKADQPVAPRRHSRDPVHVREDMAASLTLALGPKMTPATREKALALLNTIRVASDGQHVLNAVKGHFGPTAFGKATRFHLDAGTSLAGDAETVTTPGALSRNGMTFRDLRWPESALKDIYRDEAAPVDLGYESRHTAAVQKWTKEHGDPEQQAQPQQPASEASPVAAGSAQSAPTSATLAERRRRHPELFEAGDNESSSVDGAGVVPRLG